MGDCLVFLHVIVIPRLWLHVYRNPPAHIYCNWMFSFRFSFKKKKIHGGLKEIINKRKQVPGVLFCKLCVCVCVCIYICVCLCISAAAVSVCMCVYNVCARAVYVCSVCMCALYVRVCSMHVCTV